MFVNGIFYFCAPIVNIQTTILRFLKIVRDIFWESKRWRDKVQEQQTAEVNYMSLW